MTTLYAVGDVFIDLEDGLNCFRNVGEFLRTGDIVIGNCEGVYSDTPTSSPSARHVMIMPTQRAACLQHVPFHMMSCANNHMLDGGFKGMADTLETLHAQNILTSGAGHTLTDALTPAIIETENIKTALFSVASVFPMGYEARKDRAGIAPLRVRSFYSAPDPNFWEPGLEPHIHTKTDEGDLQALETAISKVREEIDFIIVACHWGHSSQFETVQNYEIENARRIIDMGADAVICHHHHSLRGIEFYHDRPICYGLGAFVHHITDFHQSAEKRAQAKAKYGDNAHGPRADFPHFPFNPKARLTGVMTFDYNKNDQIALGMVPGEILADGSTELYPAQDKRVAQFHDYIKVLLDHCPGQTSSKLTQQDKWAHIEFSAA